MNSRAKIEGLKYKLKDATPELGNLGFNLGFSVRVLGFN